MSERSAGVPGSVRSNASVRFGVLEVWPKTGDTSVLKTVWGASCPVKMTVQDQSDQFTLSKEQAKVARGSHLSRLCLQGQPPDAESGGLSTLGKTCLQGGQRL